MKTTNTAAKYLAQPPLSLLDMISIGIMVVGFLLLAFVHRGVPVSLGILTIGLLIFIFSRASRISDAAYENEVTRLLRAHDISETESGLLRAYDLSVLPVVKGRDGTWRSGIFVLTRVEVKEGQCHVTWYEADLVARTVKERQIFLDLPANVYVAEKELIIHNRENVMTRKLCFPDGTAIPITTGTMAFEVIKKKLRMS